MAESDAPDPSSLDARVVALEELLTHLQATVQTLSDELFAQSRRFDTLQREALRLQSQLAETSARLPEARRLEDEKPPHY